MCVTDTLPVSSVLKIMVCSILGLDFLPDKLHAKIKKHRHCHGGTAANRSITDQAQLDVYAVMYIINITSAAGQ